MTYELAKELKEAGFPMIKWWVKFDDDKHVVFAVDSSSGTRFVVHVGKEGWILPTLSELIEACGELGLFNSLTYCGEGEWEAVGITKETNIELDGRGLTPEEAVARLWLALNKKEHE